MTNDDNYDPKPGPPIRDRVNPLALLTKYERSMKSSDANASLYRDEYNVLIDLLRKQNVKKDVAESLREFVVKLDSEGAARALQGTPHDEIRRKIATVVEKFIAKRLDDTHGTMRATGYAAPLALAGTITDQESVLLYKAANFQRGNSKFSKEDLAFRTNAVRAIAASDGKAAHKGLFSLLTGLRDKTTRRSVVDAVIDHSTDEVQEECHELLAMPRGHAIYRIAHDYLGQGGISARLSSTLGRWRYRRVFSDLKRILEQASE